MDRNSDTEGMTRGRCISSVRTFVERVQRRLAGEEGFSLVELTIVLLVLGILLTVAVPSYLSFKDRASKTAAEANVSQAVRSVMSYGADNFSASPTDPDPLTSTTDVGYDGISLTGIAKYDPTISIVPGAPYVLDPSGWNGNVTSPNTFCLTASVGRWTAVQYGPGAPITVGTNFLAISCSVS